MALGLEVELPSEKDRDNENYLGGVVLPAYPLKTSHRLPCEAEDCNPCILFHHPSCILLNTDHVVKIL